MKNKLGKFVVLYGINNLGKSTQAKLLVEYLKKKNIKAKYIKYPIYENRSGKLINDYLRKGAKISPEDYHILQIINKFEFADKLDKILNTGTWVIAEDYILTGIAWAMSNGIVQKRLEMLYDPLRKPDKAVVLDGERFKDAIELSHKHETDDNLSTQCRKNHLKLAKEYDYPVVDANLSIDSVHQSIVRLLKI